MSNTCCSIAAVSVNTVVAAGVFIGELVAAVSAFIIVVVVDVVVVAKIRLGCGL